MTASTYFTIPRQEAPLASFDDEHLEGFSSFRDADQHFAAEIAAAEASFTESCSANIEDYLSPKTISDAEHGVAWTKLVCNLMTLLFTFDELFTCVISRKSNCQRSVLDENKVNAIVNHVTKRYPQVSTSKIRFRMSQKCKDVRVCQVRKLKDRQLRRLSRPSQF